MRILEAFAFLQLLDLLTTLIGFRLGGSEASPFIRMFLAFGPVPALFIGKAVAVALGGACVALNRIHVISYINYWYAALTAWNLAIILRLVQNIT
jgi:hypothetical protein